ncbi:hypothetical protein PMIT1323_00947 [Prochlorococcus marinus str. MIT 1323]|nr:hypothetical protein PMIT1323_00947 [Prochlorococcus marinus str. MIT 1323]
MNSLLIKRQGTSEDINLHRNLIVPNEPFKALWLECLRANQMHR